MVKLVKYDIKQFRIGGKYVLSDDSLEWICIGNDSGTLLLAMQDPENINKGLVKHIPFMDIEKVEESEIKLNRTDQYLVYPLPLDEKSKLGDLTGSKLKKILEDSNNK